MRKFLLQLRLPLTKMDVDDLVTRAIVSRNTGSVIDSIDLPNGEMSFLAVVELTLPQEVTPNVLDELLQSSFAITPHWAAEVVFLADMSKLADLQAKADKKLPIPLGIDPKQIDAELADIKTKLGKG